MRSDGSHVRKLADEGDVDDASPSWSRNGKKIVYVVDPGSGYDQIWIARVDGSGTRKLALHRKGGVVDPDWYRSSQQCGGGY
jgi:Tol biopolymer transport system component